MLLMRSTPILSKTMPCPYVISMLVPLLVRAADQGIQSLTSCFLQMLDTQHIIIACQSQSGLKAPMLEDHDAKMFASFDVTPHAANVAGDTQC